MIPPTANAAFVAAMEDVLEGQQAYRRANKLRQRLGLTGIWEDMAAAPEKPEGMSVLAYAQLLEAVLQAEMRATEAGTARLLQLATRIGSRRKRQ